MSIHNSASALRQFKHIPFSGQPSIIFLLTAFFNLTSYVSIAQTNSGTQYYVKNDTLFFNSEVLGVAKRKNDKVKCYYKTKEVRNQYRYFFEDEIRKGANRYYFEHRIDEYVSYPKLEIVDKELIFRSKVIGNTKIDTHQQPYKSIVTTLVQITIITRSVEKRYYKYIQHWTNEYYRNSLKTKNVEVLLKTDFRSEDAQRIEDFYDFVYQQLSKPLEDIEGVFKSIDQGEYAEYDIVILKSSIESNIYNAWILESTDSRLSAGFSLFYLEKTAQKNKFFMKYTLRSGESFENKLALYEGGILKSGVKSFLKMFPAEGDERNYYEINPLVDWDASGSGVLLGNTGLIATNHHVITGAKTIRVKILANDSIVNEYRAELLSSNEQQDVALLQVSDTTYRGSDLFPLEYLTKPQYGNEVYSVGFPVASKLGQNPKLNKGIVSALTGKNDDPTYFQTDLPVWYGNSGGPCFDKDGHLLGLVTLIAFDRGHKLENVSYITRVENIINLMPENTMKTKSSEDSQIDVKDFVKYSVFIKVYYD
jgi:S1-C subfamily serine protease